MPEDLLEIVKHTEYTKTQSSTESKATVTYQIDLYDFKAFSVTDIHKVFWDATSQQQSETVLLSIKSNILNY